MTKKILITEVVAAECISILKSKGYEVDCAFDKNHDELLKIVGDYDAMIVRSATLVDRALLQAGKRLKVVGRAGVTVDNIDIEAANDLDVIVCNAPTSNIVSAAEHAFALMLCAARKIAQANESMHDHKWERNSFKGVELYGKTLAIFGLGRVGTMVAERALAFGMNVLANDPYCNPERASSLGVKLENNMQKILKKADFISVHLPLTPDTTNMFTSEEFSECKTGVIFINTSRPAIVDTNALADFVAAKKIAMCCVDVFETEPCFDSPLHELENAILTPHISALTHEAQVRSGTQIAGYVFNGLEGSLVPTALSATSKNLELSRHVAPFLPAANMLGRIVAQINGRLPRKVCVKLMGNLSELDPSAIVTSVLEGILSYKHAQCTTLKEAKMFAERHGVEIECNKTDVAGEYSAGIEINADGICVASTVFGAEKLPRIISILGYKIDCAPAKHSLVFEYPDRPGNCGIIGTVLGAHGINISTMQIATSEDDTKALVYVNVGQSVDEEVLSEIEEKIDLKNMFAINL